MFLETTVHHSDVFADADALEYRVYSNPAQIQELSPAWDQLLAASSCNQAFASAEWYLASCRMNRTSMPYVIVGMRGAAIECILPLVCGSDGIAAFPHFGNDYNDLIIRNNNASLSAELLAHAFLSRQGCQHLCLSKLRPDSNCIRATPFLSAYPQLRHHLRTTNMFPYAALPESFSEYLASRSKIFRKSVRRALQKIELNGLVLKELVPAEFDPVRIPEIFIVLSISRHGEKSFLHNQDACLFVRTALPALFKKQYLHAFALVQDEQILALDLCAAHSCGLVTWNGGFLTKAKCWSPGTALFAFGIEQAIAMGLREYDFTEGNEIYKHSWATSSYAVSELNIYVR